MQFVLIAGIGIMAATRSIQDPNGNSHVVLGDRSFRCLPANTFAFVTLPVEYDASK